MSGAQSQWTGPDNPLNNPLILGNIFSHLRKIPDLKSVRLVSKLWRASSHPRWWSSATIRLLWRKDINNFCKCQVASNPQAVTVESIFDDNTLDISEYLNLMETFDGKPFVRYRIINFCVLHPIRDDVDVNVNHFWNNYGNKMKYLHLDHANFHNARIYQSFAWLLTEKCLNLEELTIATDKFPVCDQNKQPFISEVMGEYKKDCKKSLSLKCFYAKECGSSRWLSKVARWGDDITYVIGKILDLMPNLKSFKTDTKIRSWSFGLLEKQIKLEELYLGEINASFNYFPLERFVRESQICLTSLELDNSSFYYCRGLSDSNDELLKSILTLCSRSLERLSLRSYSERYTTEYTPQIFSTYFKQMVFPNLKELYTYDQPIFDFRALRGMPKLKLFHLETDHIKRFNAITACINRYPDWPYWLANYSGFQVSYNWNHCIRADLSDKANGYQFKLLQLEHLYITYYQLTPATLRVLQDVFPNLTKLEVILTKETDALVKHIWPNSIDLIRLQYTDLQDACPRNKDAVKYCGLGYKLSIPP